MDKNPRVLHISAECYPAAKAGGLADVVGALPKYLNQQNFPSQVIIPKYSVPWIKKQSWKKIASDQVPIGYYNQPYRIERLTSEDLGFEFFVIDLPWKFDRPGIYSDPDGRFYGDDAERFICFQRCVLHWVSKIAAKPDIIHCHDYHTGLIPFFIKYCSDFKALRNIPSIFTIHNGRYHGTFGWNQKYLLPYFDQYLGGLIEWNGAINPLAAGIKNAHRVTTVSRAYLEELKEDSHGLEWLLHEESSKSIGILNGIDTDVWDPKTDRALAFTLKKSVPFYKRKNKTPLIGTFGLDKKFPL
ncbi:MAG: glycogen/starch synthase, partial [Cyclobacteriaceae bacterium]|nr:glycogen/starch synthase [Cyclobacteriaceae bacterium]